ncbi:MAG TPA: ammonia monooxygenase, partial [Sporomusaceae bacterium]|nr:ammonia monooxygenase [Sporomusaceae bacterium]
VFIVPFLVLHGLADQVDPVSKTMTHFTINNVPVLALFAVCLSGAVYLGKRIKMSNPYLLAPVVVTAALVLNGIHAPALPPAVIAVAQ